MILFWPSVLLRHPVAAIIYPVIAGTSAVFMVMSLFVWNGTRALFFGIVAFLAGQCYRITRQVVIYQMLMFGSESVDDREDTL